MHQRPVSGKLEQTDSKSTLPDRNRDGSHRTGGRDSQAPTKRGNTDHVARIASRASCTDSDAHDEQACFRVPSC